MLDDEKRDAGTRQLLQLRRHMLEFGGIETGGKLVDQQQPRAGRERAREVEHLLMRAVELDGRLIGEAGEIERGQQRRGIEAFAIAAIGERDLDVLAHGQGQERPGHLEGAIDAAHAPAGAMAGRRSGGLQNGCVPPSGR